MIVPDVNSKWVTTKGIVGFKGYIGKGYLGVDIYKKTGTKGDKGDTGPDGDSGTDGTNGVKGDKGDTGATGTSGTNGTNGDKGDKGDTRTIGSSYASRQTIESTSGDVTSTLDVTIPIGTVWISPNATNATGRNYILPTDAPVGYVVFIQNNSGTTWNIRSDMTNAILYTGAINPVGLGNGISRAFRYIGQVTISSVVRNIWLWS